MASAAHIRGVMHAQLLADHGVLHPLPGHVPGHFVDSRPLGGENVLHKCKSELSFRTLAWFYCHGTKWHSLALKIKNPALSPLAVSQPGAKVGQDALQG
jgi:hypothetical protein